MSFNNTKLVQQYGFAFAPSDKLERLCSFSFYFFNYMICRKYSFSSIAFMVYSASHMVQWARGVATNHI